LPRGRAVQAGLAGFDLQDDRGSHVQIDAHLADLAAVVAKRKGALPKGRDPLVRQSGLKRPNVNVLPESLPERPIYLVAG